MVGLYVTGDPGTPSEDAKHGELLVEIGKLFEKGLRIGTGRANVKAYNRHLRDLIVAGRAKPSFVVSKDCRWPTHPTPTRASTSAKRLLQGRAQAGGIDRA